MKLHFNDHIILVVLALSITTTFFAYKWLSLITEVKDSGHNKNIYLEELESKVSTYKAIIYNQRIEIDSLKK